MNTTTGQLLTLKETANKLRISTTSLWRLRNEGRLPGIKVGGKIMFDPAVVERFLQQNTEFSVNDLANERKEVVYE